MKYKCFRFDGHVSMLQLCVGIQADMYKDRSRRLKNTRPTTVLAAPLRNCRASQNLHLGCSQPASPSALPGFPHGFGPSSEVACDFFFLVFFGRITQLKPHVPCKPFRNVAFGTRAAESQPSHAASHFFNSRKTCGAQTQLTATVMQFLVILFTSGLLLKHLSNTM